MFAMIKVLVIADDMTGAIEVGAKFAKHGVKVLVTAGRVSGEECPPVLVVDTESRHVTPAEAARRVAELAGWAKAQGIECIYKKTDSTLRGNIASELAALLEVFPDQPLIYVPAHPTRGRTCREGGLYVEGRPVHESSFAKDPLNPVTGSSIPELLREGCAAPIVTARDAQALRAALGAADRQAIYVCDGETEEDLAGTARTLQSLGKLGLTAGPGGFAETLAQTLALERSPLPAPPKVRSTLTVCGSVNPVSLAQARYAETHGFAGVEMAGSKLLPYDGGARASGNEYQTALAERIIELLEAPRHVVVRTIDAAEELPRYFERARKVGMDLAEATTFLTRWVGGLVRRVVEESEVEGLIIFGGDTAAGILQEDEISPLGELLPAIPVASVMLCGRELCVVTKAGGFGEVEVLSTIRAALVRNEAKGA